MTVGVTLAKRAIDNSSRGSDTFAAVLVHANIRRIVIFRTQQLSNLICCSQHNRLGSRTTGHFSKLVLLMWAVGMLRPRHRNLPLDIASLLAAVLTGGSSKADRTKGVVEATCLHEVTAAIRRFWRF
jgi:hypothetical protein